MLFNLLESIKKKIISEIISKRLPCMFSLIFFFQKIHFELNSRKTCSKLFISKENIHSFPYKSKVLV